MKSFILLLTLVGILAAAFFAEYARCKMMRKDGTSGNPDGGPNKDLVIERKKKRRNLREILFFPVYLPDWIWKPLVFLGLAKDEPKNIPQSTVPLERKQSKEEP